MTGPCPFSDAIRAARARARAALVADIKPVSPRDGELVGTRSPAELARLLAAAGACALSVVTESAHFGGSVEMLAEVAAAVDLPVLRKDFFEREADIDASAAAGAAAVLLTLATIPEGREGPLYARARERGMEAVVEVHAWAELERALALAPTIVGINNRDILNLEMDDGDIRVTEALAPLVPAGVTTISESSLHSVEHVRRAVAAEADAVLVGTAILKAEDPAGRVAEFLEA